jgi:hypothetical protein
MEEHELDSSLFFEQNLLLHSLLAMGEFHTSRDVRMKVLFGRELISTSRYAFCRSHAIIVEAEIYPRCLPSASPLVFFSSVDCFGINRSALAVQAGSAEHSAIDRGYG